MPAETVTYNPRTHRLEWGGPDDRTFLSVTSPWWLSQAAADEVVSSLVNTTQERDGIRKRIAEEVRAKARQMEEAGDKAEQEGWLNKAAAYRNKEAALLNVAAEIEASGKEEAGE